MGRGVGEHGQERMPSGADNSSLHPGPNAAVLGKQSHAFLQTQYLSHHPALPTLGPGCAIISLHLLIYSSGPELLPFSDFQLRDSFPQFAHLLSLDQPMDSARPWPLASASRPGVVCPPRRTASTNPPFTAITIANCQTDDNRGTELGSGFHSRPVEYMQSGDAGQPAAL